MGNRVNSVLSLTALLVAVLGVTPLGEAAYNAVVPRNSVGTLQLQRNAVKAAKIAPNAIRGGHVLDGTLLTADFKAGQIPQGPKGDKGDKGDKGNPGATKAIIKTQSFVVPGGGGYAAGQAVVCPAGAVATGGGVTTLVGLSGNLLLSSPGSAAAGPYNHPADGDVPVSWYVYLQNTGANQVQATAYAVCVSP